jgi:DNA-3-methyladenine glycosylase II
MFPQFTRTLFKVPSAAMQVRRSGRLSSNAAVISQPQAISEKKVTKRKAGIGTNEIDQDGFTIPSTPKRKKGRIEPPSTPTPAAASIMGLPYSSSDIDDTAPPRRNRLANPLFTNAPLISPQTSRIILNESIPTSLSKKIPAELTTEGILERACSHLISADPKMKALVEKAHCHVFSPEGLAEEIDPFRSLVSGIISQQVNPHHSRDRLVICI